MAEDAKNSAADEAANEKGQAKDEQNPPKKQTRKTSTAKASQPKDAKASASADQPDFQAEVRDQIENCKFEIISSLQESVHRELKNVMHDQLRKTEHRRVRGVIIRDIFILVLAVLVGYFGYCLYDAAYFDFFRPACEEASSSTCESQNSEDEPQSEPEEVKDLAWYRKNYGDLLSGLQTNLNADTVAAYYLYSGDYKLADIPAEYLLSMAYNQLISGNSALDSALPIAADDMRLAFIDTFGSADYFAKRDFTYDCQRFTYDKITDTFTASVSSCANNSNRKILEEITEIYEEGNVLYFLTTAAIYDRTDKSFYTFDNIFRPVATEVDESDLSTYGGLLNRYQYQFKRADNNNRYYFSGVTKLK